MDLAGSASPRQATEADAAAIKELIAAAYGRYVPLLDNPPAPMLRDYGAAIEAGTTWVIGDPVAGVISLHRDDGSLLVENVAVHPAAQGRGLGRLLMDFAEQEAARRGISRMTLYTNEAMTENLAIYQHLGYAETGRREQDGYRRVFMEKWLRG